jgi:uncharacterized membrane-anchored protein YhcB (DUF1043 family)
MLKYHIYIPILMTLIIAVFALVFSLADLDCKSMSFSLEKLGDIIGILVSSFALVVGFYFAILAISAYSHVKKIQDQEEKVRDLINKWDANYQRSEKLIENSEKSIKNYTETMEELSKNYAETLFDEIEEQIYIEELHNNTYSNKDRRNVLKVRRARLSYRCPMLDIEKRKQLMIELASIGDATDIEHIKKIISNFREHDSIKEVAKVILPILEKRVSPLDS